jgi:hypothetical protein
MADARSSTNILLNEIQYFSYFDRTSTYIEIVPPYPTVMNALKSELTNCPEVESKVQHR